jgi:hypothetical protein
MDDFDFTTTMTPEQIKLAKAAGKLARHHASGGKLYESLTVGESLLVGRDVAMKMSGSNRPHGKQYSIAFQAWKSKFGFVATDTGARIPQSWLDECIVCAQHRSLSDEIIASLPPATRANLGVSGLSKRVRQRLAEIEGRHLPPRVTPMAELRDQVALTAAIVSSVAPSTFGAPPETRVEMLEAALKRLGLYVNNEGEIKLLSASKLAEWLAGQPKSDKLAFE